MRKHQKGITLIGWIFLLTPLAIVFFTGIRLAPVYLNYMKVARSLERVSTDGSVNADVPSPTALKFAIEKYFDIESVDKPKPEEIALKRDGDHWLVVAEYDDGVSLIANVDLVVHFHKEVTLK
ncbi:MAG TPA: DUF4845 domain-containing protein [Steroidobacteraceae bacterium]|nr:DUF4845 domain-containing protein [Steroidobacteraceae bacterium]